MLLPKLVVAVVNTRELRQKLGWICPLNRPLRELFDVVVRPRRVILAGEDIELPVVLYRASHSLHVAVRISLGRARRALLSAGSTDETFRRAYLAGA